VGALIPAQNKDVEATLPSTKSVDLDTTSVLFFDGVCNLCNKTVDFLIRRDKKNVLRFSPLQGTTAKELLPKEMVEALPSVALVDKTGTYQRSAAILRVVAKLGGLWPLVLVFLVVPAPIRDVIYNWIGKNRYKWFGQKDSCRLPTPAERAKFLN
jgi:predicted DCC family thiol-disulfide oxidoreductase YuxK